jgi:hypothetical protein
MESPFSPYFHVNSTTCFGHTCFQVLFKLSVAAHAASPCITSSHNDGSVEDGLRFVAREIGIRCKCS